MPNEPEKRTRTRKAFHHPIPLERMAVESNRPQLLQEEGLCLDISESGLGLSAPCALQGGEVLKVSLPIKKVHTYLPVFAEVMWSQPSNGHFRIGLRVLQ